MREWKVPVLNRPEYRIFFEQYAGETFIHVDVLAKWTKGVRKSFLKDCSSLLEGHGGPVFALHDPKDSKHFKFLSMSGFVFHARAMCTDGIERHKMILRRKIH